MTERRVSVSIAGVLGGLAYFVRPDLCVFSVLISLSLVLTMRDRQVRKKSISLAAATGVTLALCIFFAIIYFRSPVPLPFYAKSLNLYSATIYEQNRGVAQVHLAKFLRYYWPLLITILAGLVVNFRQWIKLRMSEWGMLLAIVVFIVYYRFFVLQIMPFGARFYYPVWPVLVFLSAQSVAIMVDKLLPSIQDLFRKEKILHSKVLVTKMLSTGFISLLLLSPLYRVAAITKQTENLILELREVNLAHLTLLDAYDTWGRDIWFRLDRFSALPDDLVIAATEVGLPGTWNLNKTIIDLAGLNERIFSQQKFVASTLFARYSPDLIYLPHPAYDDMLKSILHSDYFYQNYEYFSANQLHKTLGVGIKRDSKYYPDMLKVIYADQD